MTSLTQILNEIESDKELDIQITEYGSNSDELEKLKKSVQETLDKIENIEKTNKKKFSEIQKFMVRFDKSKRIADMWTANLKKTLKFKVVRADYKDLWLTSLTKVNEATKKVMQDLEDTQKRLKSKEMKDVLSIAKTEGVLDSLKGFWTKLKSLVQSFTRYDKVISSLPKI